MKPALIAENVGVSTATLYRRLSEMGLQLKQFRDKNGNVSDEKMSELKAIFSDSEISNSEMAKNFRQVSLELSQQKELRISAEAQLSSAAEAMAAADARATEAEARAAAAEAEARRLSDRVEDLSRQVSEMRATLEDVRSDRDEWRRAADDARSDRDKWYQAAMQAQQLQLQQMRLLPERVPFTQRVRGWFTRKQEEK